VKCGVSQRIGLRWDARIAMIALLCIALCSTSLLLTLQLLQSERPWTRTSAICICDLS